MYVLVKARCNWADEFDTKQFWAGPKVEWEEIVKYSKNISNVEVSFGTNEGIEFSDFDDWNSHMKVTEISEEQFNTLADLFNDGRREEFSYGTAANVFSACSYCDDEEDEDE